MQKYEYPTKITWEDTIDKLDKEIQMGKDAEGLDVAYRMRDTYYLSGRYRPKTFQDAYDEVLSNCPLRIDGYNEMDVYVSFTGGAESFGKHKDTDDVLIVQAIGRMKYTLYTHQIPQEFILSPGDSLFIPEGTYHDPTTLEPRVTLSFS
jgi:ribosomal protein L16 Arg81 hydroxylase|tara:strand:+ start:568 stop:1014 length:447 start_codon:yes stop_codon:yes gene_type:complete